MYDALMKGYFIVHSFNSKDPTKTFYGTPFLPMNELKNITFELPSFTTISLAVLAKIKLSNCSEPIIIKKYYKVDLKFLTIPTYMGSNFFVDNLNEQPCCFPMSDYYQCEIKKMLNKTVSSSFFASEISMESGFIGNPGFIASSCDPYPTLGNTIISYPSVDFDCYTDLKSTNNYFSNKNYSDSLDKSDTYIILSPNPAHENVQIISNDEIRSIVILNQIGNTIKQYQNLNVDNLYLNISDLKNGMYFFKIKTNKAQVVEKLIKTN